MTRDREREREREAGRDERERGVQNVPKAREGGELTPKLPLESWKL